MHIEHLSSNEIGSFRVVCVSSSSRAAAIAKLEEMGFFCGYVLSGSAIPDRKSMLAAISKCFELEKPVSSWDVLSDLMWEALMQRPHRRIALFWHDADVMVSKNLQLFLDALDVLDALGEVCESQEITSCTHPVIVRIVALGDGLSFPPWETANRE